MKILQCGYGHIGQVLFQDFQKMATASKAALSVYDPYSPNCPYKVNDLHEHYNFAFVCVPTDKMDSGSADISIVVDLCNRIDADVIIIKSTIPVDIIRFLPQNAIFSPEFTGTTPHSGLHNYVVLGGSRGLCNKVAYLYTLIHSADFEIIYTDIKTAIIAKYMENCFLALKVTFCNEIALACKKEGVEYEDVRNIFIKDSRINASHTFVYEETPYYDSHCFNKDIPAFNAQFNLPLMCAVERINTDMKNAVLNRADGGSHE